jgi:hypothetical protein
MQSITAAHCTRHCCYMLLLLLLMLLLLLLTFSYVLQFATAIATTATGSALLANSIT